MRPTFLALTTLLALAAAPVAAHADTLDDFVLTSASHTFTWTLPALIPDYYPPGYPPPGPHVGIDTYSTSAAGTIDGAPARLGLIFITQAGGSISSGFTLYPNASTANYHLSGPILVAGPDVDFPTGTFNYTDVRIPQPGQIFDGPYTLTITPEATSTTPEPASLALLATGSLGFVSVLRLRRPHA